MLRSVGARRSLTSSFASATSSGAVFSYFLHHHHHHSHSCYHLISSSSSSSTFFSCSAVVNARRFSTASAAASAAAASASGEEQVENQFVDAIPFVEGDSSAAGSIVRKVSPRGFQSVLCDTVLHSAETKKSEAYLRAKQLIMLENNRGSILLTGPANTGKRSLMVDLVTALAELPAPASSSAKKGSSSSSSSSSSRSSKMSTAIISMRPGKACTMPGGMSAHPFFGLRLVNVNTPVEQLCSAMHRHIRLMRTAYARCVPSLQTLDVLGIDSLEDMSPNMFRALDIVCREARGRPLEPFGGIQLVATANFWRMETVDQSSPHGVYIFQTDLFFKAFPAERTLLMHKFVHRDKDLAPAVRQKLDDFTINALFGNLPNDISDFEATFTRSNLPYQLPLRSVHALQAAPGSLSSSASASSAASAAAAAAAAPRKEDDQLTCTFADYVECVKHVFPSFCRHPAKRDRTYKVGGKHSRFMSWLSMLLYTSADSGKVMGLPNKLNAAMNDVVMFSRDMINGSTGETLVRKGALGTVVGVSENILRVQLWGGDRRVISVRPMRLIFSHSTYPACSDTVTQFPLFCCRRVYPDALVMLNIAPEACIADARYFTEINEFGNFLALLRRPGNVHFTHLRAFLERPAAVHEATKNYYEALIEQLSASTFDNNAAAAKKKPSLSSSSSLQQNLFGIMPYRSTLDNRLCKNCKKHVPAAEFGAHWLECVQSCRWCSECSMTVDLAKWEAHTEKHTVVLCLDCGRALSWRSDNWKTHRLHCGAMIREISANNQLLPETVSNNALNMGMDTRDLHSVKHVSKSSLPKAGGKGISRNHKTTFTYKAPTY